MMASDDMMPDEPVSIHLENCIARGEGVMLRTSDLEPVTFSWDNGLAATTERFMVVGSGPVAPRHGHHVRLALRHLTAVVGAGFCQLTNSFDAPYLRDTTIECTDSILLSTASAPLVEQEGVDGAGTFQRQFAWHGDRNFYQGFDADAFWRIIDQNDPEESERLSFLDWISHWGQQQECLPTWGEIAWKHLPPADRPMHARTPDDYALADETKGNLAREGASDGRDVGAYAALLPPLAEDKPVRAFGRPIALTCSGGRGWRSLHEPDAQARLSLVRHPRLRVGLVQGPNPWSLRVLYQGERRYRYLTICQGFVRSCATLPGNAGRLRATKA